MDPRPVAEYLNGVRWTFVRSSEYGPRERDAERACGYLNKESVRFGVERVRRAMTIHGIEDSSDVRSIAESIGDWLVHERIRHLCEGSRTNRYSSVKWVDQSKTKFIMIT